jgi:HAE1 family hydrophobic/amphiphilic exporter-1
VEFVPSYDQGQFFVVFQAAPGTSLEETTELARGLEQVIGQQPEVDDMYLTIGSGNLPQSQGQIMIKMIDLSERDKSSFQLMDDLREEFADYPGLKLVMTSEQSEGGGLPVEISISGEKLDRLIAIAHEVEDSVRATPGAIEVDNSLGSGKPEIQVNLDRDKIADLGLNVQQIATAMRSLVSGVVAFQYREGDTEADVRLRLKEEDRNDISDISRILIPSSKEINEEFGHQFPLSYVADFDEASAFAEITRYDRQKTIKVTAANAVGFFAGDVRAAAFAKAGAIPTPPGYRVYATGEAEIQEESFGYLLDSLVLAIILIFLVLASQFESITDPFSIMLSLPMSLLGAFLGLLIFCSSISIISLIGIIMLMGLVTKNAILLIDFAKQERARGTNRTDALIQAGGIRFRPIMMTTLSMILGVFPLALGIGPGAELRAGIARAVIGGLTTSTALTLIVVPVVYSLLDDLSRKVTGKSKSDKGKAGKGNSVDQNSANDDTHENS